MSHLRICSIGRNLCRSTFNQKQISHKFLLRSNNLNAQVHKNGFSSKTSSSEPNTAKLVLFGALIGGGFGTVWSVWDHWHDKDNHMIHQRKHPRTIQDLPDVKITKRIISPNDNSGLDLVLFQFQTCPFCCKVRNYLDFMGLSYSVVEVDAVLRQDLKWSDYKKVPMLLARQADGKYVQLTDSSTIISVLASYMLDNQQDIGELAKLYPNVSFFDDNGKKVFDVMNKYFLMYQNRVTKEQSKELIQNERNWRSWSDSHLVHLISPNVYRTRAEAFETFDWFSDAGEWHVHFPKWERDMMVYVGATAMWLISKRLKKRHGLDDDVRTHMYDALDKVVMELDNKKTNFLGGQQPNLADISIFGILSSMEGCQAFKDCLQNTRIGKWFYAMKEIIVKNRGTSVTERISGNIVQPNTA